VEMVKQEVEQHLTALESFRRYSETLLSSGMACDVTTSGNSENLLEKRGHSVYPLLKSVPTLLSVGVGPTLFCSVKVDGSMIFTL